jgi:Ca2+-binding RTX toxin-like protein
VALTDAALLRSLDSLRAGWVRVIAAATIVVPVLVSLGPEAIAGAPMCFGRPATIVGTNGPNRIEGTRGADVIVGRGGADILAGFGGDDRICGNAGNDRVYGMSGRDDMDGQGGRDLVSGNNAVDLVKGGAGSDLLFGGNHHDRLFGGAGDDTARGMRFDDYVDGGGGDDFLLGADSVDHLFGRGGNDLLDGGIDADRLVGGSGSDTISYFSDSDGVRASLATGRASDGDRFRQAEGLEGSRDRDQLFGNRRSNYFFSWGEDDLVNGQGGPDVLYDASGRDSIRGGDGVDVVSYFFFEGGGVEADLVAGTVSGAGSDTLVDIESFGGTNRSDVASGGAGRNGLFGHNGADVLDGGGGADAIFGQGSSDELFGEAGDDFIDGGNGSDDAIDGGDGVDECVNGEDVVNCESSRFASAPVRSRPSLGARQLPSARSIAGRAAASYARR